jgi:hypothetical protein
MAKTDSPALYIVDFDDAYKRINFYSDCCVGIPYRDLSGSKFYGSVWFEHKYQKNIFKPYKDYGIIFANNNGNDDKKYKIR